MLPLHVAVANGLRDMYDFLISLPNMDECRELRCDRLVPSA